MFKIDVETGEIILPKGDTAQFRVKLKCKPLPEGTVAVFGISTSGSRRESLLAKAFDVADNEVQVRLTNHDTRELKTGNHVWDLRIVTDPDRDPETGEVRANDPGDNVYSIFSGSSEFPAFRVTPITAEV